MIKRLVKDKDGNILEDSIIEIKTEKESSTNDAVEGSKKEERKDRSINKKSSKSK